MRRYVRFVRFVLGNFELMNFSKVLLWGLIWKRQGKLETNEVISGGFLCGTVSRSCSLLPNFAPHLTVIPKGPKTASQTSRLGIKMPTLDGVHIHLGQYGGFSGPSMLRHMFRALSVFPLVSEDYHFVERPESKCGIPQLPAFILCNNR